MGKRVWGGVVKFRETLSVKICWGVHGRMYLLIICILSFYLQPK